MRVLRGGAWDSTAEQCRSAYRHKEFPVYSDACFGADSYGFRRARNAESRVQTTAVAAASPPAILPPPEKRVVKPAAVIVPPPASAKIDLASLKGTIVFVSDRS